MDDLDAQIKALTDRFEREQRERQAAANAADPDKMHKIVVAAIDKAIMRADVQAGRVEIRTFDC